MKKSKVFLTMVTACFFLLSSITATAQPAVNQKGAINNPGLWDPVSTLKAESKMGSYYTVFLDSDFAISAGKDGKLFYTEDGGSTWKQGKNSSSSLYGLDIVDYEIAWACGKGGCIRFTKDGGKTWKAASNFGKSNTDQLKFISFISDKTGWVASSKKLASTTNMGSKWKEIKLPSGVKEIAAVELRTANDGYLLDSKGMLYITANAGKTWSKIDPGIKKLKLANGKISLGESPSAAINFANAKAAILAFSAITDKNKSVICDLMTFDGGKTWKQYILPCTYSSPSICISNNALILTIAGKNKGSLFRENVSTYLNQLMDAMHTHHIL